MLASSEMPMFTGVLSICPPCFGKPSRAPHVSASGYLLLLILWSALSLLRMHVCSCNMHSCVRACAQALMDSDVRNLGRLCHFVSATLPFDPFLVSAALVQGHRVSPVYFCRLPANKW